MLNLDNAIREIGNGIATTTTSTVRTAVGGLAILESHVAIRTSEDAHNARRASWEMATAKDLSEKAKSLGYNSVQDAIKASRDILDSLK